MYIFPNFVVLMGFLVWLNLGCNLADIVFSLPFLCMGAVSGILTAALDIDVTPYFKVRKTFFILLQIFFTVPLLLFFILGNTGFIFRMPRILLKINDFLPCIYLNSPYVLFVLESICFLEMKLWKHPKELFVILLSDPCLAAFLAVLVIRVMNSARI